MSKDAGKALPPRPERNDENRDSTNSMVSNGSSVISNGDQESTSTLKGGTAATTPTEARTIAPALVPKRRESLLPSAFEYSGPTKTAAKATIVETSLRIPVTSVDIPPPLSPRRPGSPHLTSPERTRIAQDPQRLQAPSPRARARSNSNESTSWLDTIDESGGSDRSSVHSRSSAAHLRRKQIRVASGGTEAEFDAALDAAVEAAYGEGLEPADSDTDLENHGRGTEDTENIYQNHLVSNVRKNVELARERVREAEREAAIQISKDREKQRLLQGNALQGSNSFALDYGDEEAEEKQWPHDSGQTTSRQADGGLV